MSGRTWISVTDAMPVEKNNASRPVTVLLDNGEQAEDFTINGKWVFYCKTNPGMPHIVAWREKDGTNC